MELEDKKIIVISAISLFKGGTFSILKEVLEHLSYEKYSNYRIIALVHSTQLLELYKYPFIEFIEFRKSRKSWFYKLYYEYYYFSQMSEKLKPFLWFSLHDSTPKVIAQKQVVYCHNPSPFVSFSLKYYLLEPSFFFFNFLYKFVYKINLKKNNYVVVQQQWLREKFVEQFNLPKEKIIVAYPLKENNIENIPPISFENKTFIYPVYPRVFKNFEVIGEAVKLLNKKAIYNFQVIFTIDGTENIYSKQIYRKYALQKNITFLGYQEEAALNLLYEKSMCLIFPSKVETWGLPISEFKIYKKPILLADCLYAKETIGTYDHTFFFNPDNAEELCLIMEDLINGNRKRLRKSKFELAENPVATNWEELFTLILADN